MPDRNDLRADCFGAGQRVSRVTLGGRSWRDELAALDVAAIRAATGGGAVVLPEVLRHPSHW